MGAESPKNSPDGLGRAAAAAPSTPADSPRIHDFRACPPGRWPLLSAVMPLWTSSHCNSPPKPSSMHRELPGRRAQVADCVTPLLALAAGTHAGSVSASLHSPGPSAQGRGSVCWSACAWRSAREVKGVPPARVPPCRVAYAVDADACRPDTWSCIRWLTKRLALPYKTPALSRCY